jgi:long-chain acyl-CoA synthetase
VLVPGEGGPVRLSVVDVGPEQPERTLVLVHGFAGTSAWWRYQMEALMDRHRLIALDLRGHGWSGRPAGGYRLAQLAADIAAVLDALPVRSPVVAAGHSVGGFVAAELALRYPERVGALILIATPVRIRRQDLPWPARIAVRVPYALAPLLQRLYTLHPKGRRDNAYLRGLKQLFSADVLNWDGEARLPQVTQPALVITGDRDFAFPGLAYTRVAELISRAEHVNVGVSKHQVLLERPKAVVRAIERFLQAPPAPGAAWQPQWRSENDAVDSIALLRERPWVARYETGVPDLLDVPRVPLTRLLDTAARRHGLRQAVRRGAQVVTYRRWRLDSGRLANALRALGLAPGEHVALALPDGPALAVAFYGVLRAGGVAALLPPGLAPAEAQAAIAGRARAHRRA